MTSIGMKTWGAVPKWASEMDEMAKAHRKVAPKKRQKKTELECQKQTKIIKKSKNYCTTLRNMQYL